jgi:hypothetical protein
MASLYIVKEDLMGDYDYKVDVMTMNVNADQARKQARQTAISLLVTNPNVAALLAQDQTKPRFAELMISWLEELGWTDADRYFEAIPNPNNQNPGTPGQPQQPGAQPGQPPMPGAPMGSGAAQVAPQPAPQQAQAAPQQNPALQQVMGYYNYAPPNSLQGVPIWIQQKYEAKYGEGGAYPGGPGGQ